MLPIARADPRAARCRLRTEAVERQLPGERLDRTEPLRYHPEVQAPAYGRTAERTNSDA